MKSFSSVAALVLLAACPLTSRATTFRVDKADAASWTRIFQSIGITQDESSRAGIIVIGPESKADAVALSENHFVILEGLGPAAKLAGISEKPDKLNVRQICDLHAYALGIIWQQAVEMHEAALPGSFEIFAKEKWTGAPVLAGKRTAGGALLWLAADPGARGTERFPYLLQSLADLGLAMPVRATNLWAFFDSAYRIRADTDYLARRWRQAGISALQVAAWHNLDGDPTQDEYLKNLIEACHRNAILVYAWLELPHVSDKFWADHAQWREKTAVGQDAQLDWRKLMNLQNPECRATVSHDIHALLQRFDWDGVNVAELYFESLEGASNPARLTPMNDDVRREFAKLNGFDPELLFDPKSAYSAQAHPDTLRKFLEYRADLTARMQRDWLDVIEVDRRKKPYLDLVLTQIDDRFEPGIRDQLGADTSMSLSAVREHHGTLLVEDPATLWNAGPERYRKLAGEYARLTRDRSGLGVDVNVVDRYQDVYPTKKQTGVELFQLVHEAAADFGRVALYVENSLEKQDLGLLPVAASLARMQQTSDGAIEIESPGQVRVLSNGLANVDGKPWPVQSSDSILVPFGQHTLTPAAAKPAVTIIDFNGEVRSAVVSNNETDIAYVSGSRAIAVLERPVSLIEVDGEIYRKSEAAQISQSIILPSGQHVVSFHR
ncbi:MAG: hypothetical protein JO270_01780 [Acidobacteriaceae bacterium]|nr:hypothetical protein [Acidobacteriaceae bacterium]